MKRIAIALGVLLSAVAVTALLVIPRVVREKTREYPRTEVRNAVKRLHPSDVREVVFPQLINTKNNGVLERVVVTDPRLVGKFLKGLQVAAYPCDPKSLPGNQLFTVELVLNDGRAVGPFGFGTDGPDHAFSRDFAEALNDVSPGLVRKM
jgi:hypothetical protein